MLAKEPISNARSLLNDTTGGRWSERTLMNFLTMTQRELMRDVKWPPARLVTNSVAGQQEYVLPDSIIRIYSVYIKGQLYTETRLDTLEGHQIQQYDQRGFGTQAPGSGGPSGNAGMFVPRWTVQPPMTTPNGNSWGYPRPDAQAWSSGSPPRYYLKNQGGSIGFIPIPFNGPDLDIDGNPIPDITIDCVISPKPILALTQRIWFPDIFDQALIWGIVEKAKYSDDTSSTKESRTFARERYVEQTGKLRMWASNYTGDSAQGPKMQTNRNLYPGRKLRSWGDTGYP